VVDATAKGELSERLARVGKAVGSGKRLELVDLLAQGPRSVADLAATDGLGLTTASAHLQVLKQAGLVTTTRVGATIRYRLAGQDVAALYVLLRDVATTHLPGAGAAVARYLDTEHGDDTEQVGREELLRRVREGAVVVLDVRPATEFAAGYIPGAVSMPFRELSERLSELPAYVEVVAYCRGAHCVLAHDAVRLLTAHGRRAVRLADGMVEWRLTGRPVATAS
jgi:rhodanese-related sulfurtransferase